MLCFFLPIDNFDMYRWIHVIPQNTPLILIEKNLKNFSFKKVFIINYSASNKQAFYLGLFKLLK